MSDLRTRLADALRAHRPNRFIVGEPDVWECTRGCTYAVGAGIWYDHLADVLLSLPDIAIVDREELAKAIAGGIQNYGGGEADSYSYHGDGSALEAMHRLAQDADSIAEYIFTSTVLSKGIGAPHD